MAALVPVSSRRSLPGEGLHALVVGGGIGGLTAALCLARLGHHVSVFEEAPQFEDVGAGVQISPNGAHVLHALGLEAELKAQAFQPEAAVVRHWRSGKTIMTSPLGESVHHKYGFPYYHLHRADLHRVLSQAVVQQSNIELRLGASVAHVQARERSVSVSHRDRTCQGDLLIGADGIHSAIRRNLWGLENAQFTGNVAWRALVDAARMPAGLIPPVSGVWWGPGKHFVHYYVRGGTLINCVCVVEKQGWEVESWTVPGELTELKADFAGWHPHIQALIDQADSDSLYKWALYDRQPIAPWGQGLMTLLGDAVHPTLPFLAQGANMAIEDGMVLANCLTCANTVDQGLRRYEALRGPRTAGIQRQSRRNARLFHLAQPMATLRDVFAQKLGDRTLHNIYAYRAAEVGIKP